MVDYQATQTRCSSRAGEEALGRTQRWSHSILSLHSRTCGSSQQRNDRFPRCVRSSGSSRGDPTAEDGCYLRDGRRLPRTDATRK